MKKKTVNNLILIILYIGLLHTSAYANMIEEYRNIDTNYVLLRNSFMFILLFYNLIRNNTLPKLFSNRFCNIWYIFSIVVMISVFPSNIGQGIKLLLIPIVYFIILQYDDKIIQNFSIAASLNGLWILCQSLMINPVFFGMNYSGIYNNPNTFGASMVVFFVGSLCVILLTNKRWIKVVFAGFCVVSFYYELLSYCRTALLASIVVLFVVFFVHFKDILKEKRIFIPVFIAAILIVLYVVIQYQTIFDSIYAHIYKWGSTATDLSSSRLEMWKSVILNPTLLGSAPAFSPHNNFIMVLYQHGIIAGLIFAALIVYVIFKYYFLYKKHRDVKTLVALLLILMFACVSMFEESLGFTGREWMCLGFVGFGYAINELKAAYPSHIKVKLKK